MTPVTTAATSGLQGGMFGANTEELFALYDRALAAGMTPERAAQIIGADVAPEQFLAQIEQLEQRASLGTPVYSPARTSEQTQVRTQAAAEGIRAQQALDAAALEASRQLTPEQQAIEDRFGNDMSWLDPYFQRTAATAAPVTSQDALQYGTTADPGAQAMERSAIAQLFDTAGAGPSAGERYALDQQRQAIQQLFGTAAAGPTEDEQYAFGQQRQAITDLFNRSAEGPSAGEREALDAQRGVISRLLGVADEGATPEERAGLTTAMGAAQDLVSRGRAGATDDERSAIGDQRRALESLFADYGRGASDVELEAQGTQRRAMNELMGVWEGGGATALERARRARAQSERENWLLGQRQADMYDLAERGMGGSGAELAALAQDRQAAASRLSLEGLETDAALEERALQALMGSSGVAGELLSGEGNIQARRLQQLLGAGGAARGISDTLGGIEGRSTQQLAAGGGMARDVAGGYTDIEARGLQALQGAGANAGSMAGTYGDIEARALQALLGANQGAASLASGYGDVSARALQALLGANQGAASLASGYGNVEERALQALMGARAGAADLREGSDRFVQQNADRLFDANTFNAEMINDAAADNQQFVQDAWRDTMADRLRWDMQTRQLQTGAASDLLGTDVRENQTGFGQGYDTAASDVSGRNSARGTYNVNTLGVQSGSAPVIYDAQGNVADAGQAGLRTGAQTTQQLGNAALTYVSGGMSGLTGMGRQTGSSGTTVTNPTDEQNPYRNYRY